MRNRKYDASVLTINKGRLAADHLERIGEHKRAEDVRSLARSNAALRAENARLRTSIASMKGTANG